MDELAGRLLRRLPSPETTGIMLDFKIGLLAGFMVSRLKIEFTLNGWMRSVNTRWN
jgi:hypothetical protein